MKKDFKYSIRIKATGTLIVEEIVSFGTKKYPFPEDWKNSGIAVRSLDDYKNSIIDNHFEISYKEFDKSEEIEKMDKIYYTKDCIEFALWLRANDTQENAEEFANFSDEDMFNYWIKNFKK